MSIRAMKWVAEVLPCIDLPPTERCVLWFLAYRHHDKTGECFPSIETIAAACGVSERRARTAIQNLKQWRLITVKRGATPSGNACNRYTLFGRPKRPRRTGTKNPVQSGKLMPFSNRHTVADDRGNTSNGEHRPKNLRVVSGGQTNV